jgi:hypothetical protein
MNLNENGRLVLLALVRSLRADKSAYVGLREVRKNYELVCEELNIKSVEKFEEIIQDDRHIILLRQNMIVQASVVEIA